MCSGPRSLIAALAAGAINAFPAALEDRFHQPYREALVPGLLEILNSDTRSARLRVKRSRPFLLVFFERGYESVWRPGSPDLPLQRARIGNPAFQHRALRLRTDRRPGLRSAAARRAGLHTRTSADSAK